MPDGKSWSKSLQSNNEIAEERIAQNVRNCRYVGYSTAQAFQLVGRILGIGPRRTRTLFWKDGTHTVVDAQLGQIMRGTIRLLRILARQMHELASDWEAEATRLEVAQKQLSLWGGPNDLPVSVGVPKRARNRLLSGSSGAPARHAVGSV